MVVCFTTKNQNVHFTALFTLARFSFHQYFLILAFSKQIGFFPIFLFIYSFSWIVDSSLHLLFISPNLILASLMFTWICGSDGLTFVCPSYVVILARIDRSRKRECVRELCIFTSSTTGSSTTYLLFHRTKFQTTHTPSSASSSSAPSIIVRQSPSITGI